MSWISWVIFLGVSHVIQATKKNVLVLMIDDLKVTESFKEINSYTPNLDKFSQHSYTFQNAHAQFPMCGPSRASILTGLLPSRLRIYINNNGPQICDYRRKVEKRPYTFQTLNEAFTRQGYETRGLGKIYHKGTGQKSSCGDETAAIHNRWSKSTLFQVWSPWKQVDWNVPDKFNTKAEGCPVYQFMDVKPELEDDLYLDMNMTNLAIQELQELTTQSRPWFFFMGFRKPHLPYIAPKRFWDLFEGYKFKPPTTRISRSLRRFKPFTREDTQYKRKTPKHDFIKMAKGYYACVAYVDELVGRVLQTLEESGKKNDTIIVVTSDHGYHVGEHGFWAKHTVLENALRVPLMIYDSRVGSGTSHAPVELLDLFPTLVDLAGLDASNIQPLDGVSLKPLMNGSKQWVKPFARSYWRFGSQFFKSKRSMRYRYVKRNSRQTALIDFKTDPDEKSDLKKKRWGIYKKLARASMMKSSSSMPPDFKPDQPAFYKSGFSLVPT